MIVNGLRFLVVFILTMLLTKCATVTAPTGGAKDQLPPQLLSSTTENFATNFNSSNIILTFNEFVKLNNPSQNISTSPPLDNSIGFKAIKNKLFITFKESLEEDLTYHINFGNSIQDVNEGNSLENFQFIFSTGDKIDSLEVTGKLLPINEVEITKNTLVGLYRNIEDDSAFMKEPPFYFTYVGDDGRFSFRNIKNGEYNIRALSDENGNRYYDLPNESIGFLSESLNLDKNILNLEIELFKAEQEEIRIADYSNSIIEYQANFSFSKSLGVRDKYEVSFLNDSININVFERLNEERNVLDIFFDSSIKNISQIKSVIKVNEIVIDTFEHTISNLKLPIQEFSLESENLLNFDTLRINCTVPVASICEKIQIIDTLKADTMPFSVFKLIDNQLSIKMDSRLKREGVYTLLIQDSCLIDVLGRKNLSYEKIFKIDSEENRGTLNLNFEDVDSLKNYVVSFINSEEKVIGKKTISAENKVWSFKNIPAGNYSLKIVEDENGDGVWNSGSLIRKTFPEKIYDYEKKIVIRENWELEETIELGFVPKVINKESEKGIKNEKLDEGNE